MDEKLAAQIGHWIYAIFITGGGIGAVIAWYLTYKRKPKPSHERCSSELNEHKQIDIREFSAVYGHIDKQYNILLDITSDLGKIKGALGVE